MTFRDLLSRVTDSTDVKAEVELKTPFGYKVVSENRTKIEWFQKFTNTVIKYCTVGEMEVECVIPELTNDNGKIGLTVRLFEKDNIW